MFVRKDLSRVVEYKVIGGKKHNVRYRQCLLIFFPIAFSSMANILGCDGIECYQAAVEEQGPGAVESLGVWAGFGSGFWT
eukprot:g30363.t1